MNTSNLCLLRDIKTYIFVAFLIIVLSPFILAQENTEGQPKRISDSTRVIIISQVVGEKIDSIEKRYYHLFPFYTSKEFLSAQFFQRADSSIFLKADMKDGETRTLVFSKTDFIKTKEIIEKNQKQAEKQMLNAGVLDEKILLQRREERDKIKQENRNPEVKKKRKEDAEKLKKTANNVYYIEALGNLTPYSLNFEKVLFRKENKLILTIRGGVSYMKYVNKVKVASTCNPYWSLFSSTKPGCKQGYEIETRYFKKIPFLTSINISKGESPHYIECSIGGVYNYIPQASQWDIYGEKISSYWSLTGNLGYRYQKRFSHIFFRVGVCTFSNRYYDISRYSSSDEETLFAPYACIGKTIK